MFAGARYYLIGLVLLIGTGGYLAIAKREILACSLIVTGTTALLKGFSDVVEAREKGGEGGN